MLLHRNVITRRLLQRRSSSSSSSIITLSSIPSSSTSSLRHNVGAQRRRTLCSSSSAAASTTTVTANSAKNAKKSRHLFSWYTDLLESHPISTKVITSGVILGGGDAACQSFTLESWKDYECRRTAKFVFMGSIIVAPALHLWYGLLSRMFPQASTSAALKRLAMDQLVFAPTFIPTFFVGLQFLDGDYDLDKIRHKLEADYVDTLLANWALWVPAQAINFRFVPVSLQVLYSNAIGFVWNIFMSFQSFKEQDKGNTGISKQDRK